MAPEVHLTLAALITDPAAKARLIDGCVQAVESEVRAKSGLSGMALKAGYAAFQKVKPGMTRAGVVRLLPGMAVVLDRHWSEGGADPSAHLIAHRGRVADDLLGVTDDIAARSRHATLVRMYRALRGTAHEHVAAGVPRLAALLAEHLR